MTLKVCERTDMQEIALLPRSVIYFKRKKSDRSFGISFSNKATNHDSLNWLRIPVLLYCVDREPRHENMQTLELERYVAVSTDVHNTTANHFTAYGA